jgi:hypothetical protein
LIEKFDVSGVSAEVVGYVQERLPPPQRLRRVDERERLRPIFTLDRRKSSLSPISNRPLRHPSVSVIFNFSRFDFGNSRNMEVCLGP